MIDPSKLRYAGIVLLMAGLGVSILTVVRGLPTNVNVIQFGISGNSTSPIFMPSIWPPRIVRIAVYSDGEIDLLFFDRPNYDLFMRSGNATPLKEFKGLRSGVIDFEIPFRGEYYIVARNEGASPVNFEIVLTFWGFERDLLYLSLILIILGASFLISGYFLKKLGSR